MVPSLTPETLALVAKNPSAYSSPNAKALISSLNTAIASGAYAGWNAEQIQTPFYDLIMGSTNGINGKPLDGVNLSEFDPTGRDFYDDSSHTV